MTPPAVLTYAMTARPAATGPCHEAWLYAGEEEFAAGAARFVRGGLGAGEAVMVSTTPSKLRRLERDLGEDAARVRLVDMTEAGRNPGRILPLWGQFVAEAVARGRRARGIGEPVYAARSGPELDECRRHEALLNEAFAPDASIWTVCPYDTTTLAGDTLREAAATHPTVRRGGIPRASTEFDPGLPARALEGDLPMPRAVALAVAVDRAPLAEIRERAAGVALEAGLGARRAQDLRLIVTELATNALRHGGGAPRLVLWVDHEALFCQVDDAGRLSDPMAGRTRPHPTQIDGYGLWLVHQLSDLVQVRSSSGGTRVRATILRR